MIISALKKMLGLNKNDSTESWHTLEDIRDKTKKDQITNTIKFIRL